MKIAVIEIVFGELAVDDLLVKRRMGTNEEMIEPMNGCICCTVSLDTTKNISVILLLFLYMLYKCLFVGVMVLVSFAIAISAVEQQK